MSLILSNFGVSAEGCSVVQAIDLEIKPGQVTALIGANGAGKSELVLGMAGMLAISSGEITVDGQRLNGAGPDTIRRAGVAAVPEGHRVLTNLSIDDNLRAAGGAMPGQLRENLDRTYAIFPELAERKGQAAGTLSGGQQQMVALGHALMCRPKYLLIDEMSLGLAPLIVRRLLGVVSTLKSEGVGILLIEQFTDLALGIAETAVVLRTGRMRFGGSAQELREDPEKLHAAYFGV